ATIPQRLHQFPQVRFQIVAKRFDRYMIHARSALVRRYLAVAPEQVTLREHLVNQSEPFASFDALFERSQHAFGPDCGFRPAPTGQNVSVLLSRSRHCRRLLFSRSRHHASISLLPFAPPALLCFFATMDALTPAG